MKSKNFELGRDSNVYYNRELVLTSNKLVEVWSEFEVGKTPDVCKEYNMTKSEIKELWDLLTKSIINGKAKPKDLEF
jgi:hypothetical protein